MVGTSPNPRRIRGTNCAFMPAASAWASSIWCFSQLRPSAEIWTEMSAASHQFARRLQISLTHSEILAQARFSLHLSVQAVQFWRPGLRLSGVICDCVPKKRRTSYSQPTALSGGRGHQQSNEQSRALGHFRRHFRSSHIGSGWK